MSRKIKIIQMEGLFIELKNFKGKVLILLAVLVLAVMLSGAVSAATTTNFSPNGKTVSITSTYGASTLQTHQSSVKKNGAYGYGLYTTVTFAGKDIKGRTSNRIIMYFNNMYKTSTYSLTDHKGYVYNSKATSGKSQIFGTITGRLNNGLKFSGSTVANYFYLKGNKLVKNSSGILRFWQNGKFYGKIFVQDTPVYTNYSGGYQMSKVTETTKTSYGNGDSRISKITSIYNRNTAGVLKSQKLNGISYGKEKISGKTVTYTGKIYISTKLDPKDLFNEKIVFGDYREFKTSISPILKKYYPLEVINFS